MPSVPVTGAGVVIVATVSGVNRVAGSMPPGGTSGGGVLGAAAEGGVLGGAALDGAAVHAAASSARANRRLHEGHAVSRCTRPARGARGDGMDAMTIEAPLPAATSLAGAWPGAAPGRPGDHRVGSANPRVRMHRSTAPLVEAVPTCSGEDVVEAVRRRRDGGRAIPTTSRRATTRPLVGRAPQGRVRCASRAAHERPRGRAAPG